MAETTKRMGHPYHMYDAIQAQPALVAEVLQANASRLDGAAEIFRRQPALTLCGIGTSFHAALVGEYLVRLIAGDQPPTRAAHSFEFVQYPSPLRPGTGVLVISHRGTKNYSLQALFRANEFKAPTVTITGKDSAEGIRKARIVMVTVEQEISAAHTKSYTASMALLAGLAARLGRAAGADVAVAEAQLGGMPAAMGFRQRRRSQKSRRRSSGSSVSSSWEAGRTRRRPTRLPSR